MFWIGIEFDYIFGIFTDRKVFKMNTKEKEFERIAKMLMQQRLSVVAKDDSRPWGGFFVIDEAQAKEFATHFFPEENFDEIKISEKLSPKILVVAPEARLSWQYHERRAELWKCIGNKVVVVTSDNDEEKQERILRSGDVVKLKQGERHRLVGTDDWGVVAEIWQHTDAGNPSNEDDIIRVQDDYGRN